jgi:hypothetical protein
MSRGVSEKDTSRALLPADFDLSFGLSLGDVTRPNDAWRDVLSTGQVPERTKPRRVITDYRQELKFPRPTITPIDRG